MKRDPYFTPHTKIKMDQRPKLRPNCIKLLEENIRQKLPNTGVGNYFLDMTAKAHASKEKAVKFGFIKTICASKGIINRVRRQSKEWENTSVNVSGKGLISRIYTGLLKLNNNNKNIWSFGSLTMP